MTFIKYLLALNYFFWRKSQHYLNGDWKEYTPFTFRQKLYEPIAYLKFMYWAIKDYRGVVPKYRQ